MAQHAEVKKQMQVFVDKLNDIGPDVASGWGGSVQFVFPDLNTGWLVKLNMEGTVESCVEKVDKEAATGILIMDSDTWVGIMTKKIPPGAPDNTHYGLPQGWVVEKSEEALVKVSPAIVD